MIFLFAWVEDRDCRGVRQAGVRPSVGTVMAYMPGELKMRG